MKQAPMILAGVGALNWGLVEFLNFNLVTSVAGLTGIDFVTTVIYALVAISGGRLLLDTFKKK